VVHKLQNTTRKNYNKSKDESRDMLAVQAVCWIAYNQKMENNTRK